MTPTQFLQPAAGPTERTAEALHEFIEHVEEGLASGLIKVMSIHTPKGWKCNRCGGTIKHKHTTYSALRNE